MPVVLAPHVVFVGSFGDVGVVVLVLVVVMLLVLATLGGPIGLTLGIDWDGIMTVGEGDCCGL